MIVMYIYKKNYGFEIQPDLAVDLRLESSRVKEKIRKKTWYDPAS